MTASSKAIKSMRKAAIEAFGCDVGFVTRSWQDDANPLDELTGFKDTTVIIINVGGGKVP